MTRLVVAHSGFDLGRVGHAPFGTNRWQLDDLVAADVRRRHRSQPGHRSVTRCPPMAVRTSPPAPTFGLSFFYVRRVIGSSSPMRAGRSKYRAQPSGVDL